MNSPSFSKETTPEQLTAKAVALIGEASKLSAPNLIIRDERGRRDELHVGSGFLTSLRKPFGDTINMGVTITPEAAGKYPARTLIRKENGVGILTVALEGEGAESVEGTFESSEPGIGVMELDREKTLSVAAATLSALEGEIIKRDPSTPQNLRALLDA